MEQGPNFCFLCSNILCYCFVYFLVCVIAISWFSFYSFKVIYYDDIIIFLFHPIFILPVFLVMGFIFQVFCLGIQGYPKCLLSRKMNFMFLLLLSILTALQPALFFHTYIVSLIQPAGLTFLIFLSHSVFLFHNRIKPSSCLAPIDPKSKFPALATMLNTASELFSKQDNAICKLR